MRAGSIVLLAVASCGYPPLDSTGGDGGNGNGCQVPTSYGAATVSQPSGDFFPGAPNEIDFQGSLNSTDVLALWLFDSDPPFATGFRTGTFDLSGQTVVSTCGSCVLIAAHCNNCDLSNGQGVGSWYLANAGTLMLSTLTQTSVAGTVTNATLVHVEIDLTSGATTPASDGCTTHVASVSVSASLAQH